MVTRLVISKWPTSLQRLNTIRLSFQQEIIKFTISWISCPVITYYLGLKSKIPTFSCFLPNISAYYLIQDCAALHVWLLWNHERTFVARRHVVRTRQNNRSIFHCHPLKRRQNCPFLSSIIYLFICLFVCLFTYLFTWKGNYFLPI